MLVDFAPYLFRGKLSGFLTRLSATGLANVTSGGGQVPAFVVSSPGPWSLQYFVTRSVIPGRVSRSPSSKGAA